MLSASHFYKASKMTRLVYLLICILFSHNLNSNLYNTNRIRMDQRISRVLYGTLAQLSSEALERLDRV